jgi:ABC-type nitrate/sulfonate/bicarbonate transport system ATPase subunit
MIQGNGSTPKVRVESLSKSYHVDGNRVPVLDRVDLSVDPGEFVSIIGPSGCGKSTLLNIIAGLDHVDSGSVALDGNSDAPRLGRIGYMHQKDLLLPWRSVLDNAVIGLELQDVPRKQARKRALQLMGLFGLDGFENQYPFALSGGMRQRAAFLRTMLLDQELVLLDEPFGALDALTRVQMQEWLLSIWETLKKTIVLITHDVDEAILLSDRVYVLTPRPGNTSKVIPVGLPRPRAYTLVADPSFNRLKSDLVDTLRQDSPASGAVTCP